MDESSKKKRKSRPQKRIRAKAYAAVEQVTSCPSVISEATLKLFHIYLKKGTASISCRYARVLRRLGIHRGGNEKAVSAVPKDVENIHTKGMIIISAPVKRAR
jgi:hypothetical protein